MNRTFNQDHFKKRLCQIIRFNSSTSNRVWSLISVYFTQVNAEILGVGKIVAMAPLPTPLTEATNKLNKKPGIFTAYILP